jgi:phosphatidylglycerophosphate synthase
MMSELAKAKRINDILFGPLERPALKWLAEHMPAWMNPDILTAIGLVGTLMNFAGYLLSGLNINFLWLAIFGYVVNWFGDSLDGTLARHRHIERPRYGFLVDHTVDVISGVILVLGIGLSPFCNFTIASLTLIAWLMTNVLVGLLTIVNGVFRISSGKIGPTEIRVILIIGTLAIYVYPKALFTAPFGAVSLFDIFAALLGVILLVLFFVNSTRDIIKFARLDAEALEEKAALTEQEEPVKVKKTGRVKNRRRRTAARAALAVKGGTSRV